MDNILFVPSVPASEWCREVLPDISPLELPVAGKRFVDYALECAQRFDVLMAEIIDWDHSERLDAEFADLTKNGVAVFYIKGEGGRPKCLDDLSRMATPLTQSIDDGLVVVWGLCLTGHQRSEVAMEPATPEELADTPPGIYRRDGGRWMKILPHGLVVRGIRAWHNLNFSLLAHPDLFTLPGYSAEEGVHLGRNVVLELGTEAKPPLLLQDNVWCSRNVRLDGEVILGRGVHVSEGATLRRTVVCDDTFIGEGLELVDKIVCGRRVIDAASEAWMDVDESGVASSIGGGPKWLAAIWRFLHGTSRGRR